MATPELARDDIIAASGFSPRGPESQIYSLTEGGLSLIGTSEITIGGYLSNTVIPEEDLPIKIYGVSHCFRTEAGSAGRQSKGLYRVHQFSKVELYQFVHPDMSAETHEEMLAIEEEFYQFEKLELLRGVVKKLITSRFDQFEVDVSLNTRDNPSKSDYYLTLTGSAIESGDEGVVGRGNRYSGVIPFTRQMSMEACCGKNPVYHVGKLYTVIASLISSEIFEITGIETCIYLTSQMGISLSDPWSICVEMCGKEVASTERQMFEEIIGRNLANANETTRKIVNGELNLF